MSHDAIGDPHCDVCGKEELAGRLYALKRGGQGCATCATWESVELREAAIEAQLERATESRLARLRGEL